TEADWTDPTAVPLDAKVYSTTSSLDALGRVLRQTLPDGTTRQYVYQRAGGLGSSLISTPDGALAGLAVTSNAQFNARGQRTGVVLGNGTSLPYQYNPATFRLVRITAQAAQTLLDLSYVHDPVGNIVWSADQEQMPAAPGPFLTGLNVSPECGFVYDEFY